MNELSSQEIKSKLISSGILDNKIAKIYIEFLGIKSETLNKDSIGSIIQTWLEEWFIDQKIYFSKTKNSQERPDFFISKDRNKGFLEIKAFLKSPSFDIQSWNAFLNLMLITPNHIYADYLIFEYEILNNSFRIKNLYLKKIWEISRPMNSQQAKINWPVNVQYKNNEIVNLRPRSDLNGEKYFNSEKEFLIAIQKTIDMYKKSDKRFKKGKWLEKVKKTFKRINKRELF